MEQQKYLSVQLLVEQIQFLKMLWIHIGEKKEMKSGISFDLHAIILNLSKEEPLKSF